MKTALVLIQIGISLALLALILLQSNKGGLGSAFGRGEMYRTKRGAEKIVFISTIVVAFLFFIISLTHVVIR